MKQITRRQSLRFLSKAAVATAVIPNSWQHYAQAALQSKDTIDRFIFGVASGDPTHSSIVIWTKLNLKSKDKEQVHWVIAPEPSFKKIVKSGSLTSREKNDFTVKVNVKGLQPGKQYYYKFIHQGVESEPGRTRTLPEGNLEKLGIALASCSNYPFGYFNAYEAIAKDESIDFVLHLGDYIYEYGNEGYGAKTGKALGREHIPAHETISLQDYRLRHAQYKSDLSSRLMHAAHPIITIWDDHESANNPYMQGAQNHQKNEGDWGQRRNNALQAYYEWMPIRDPKKEKKRAALWRSFEFGNLATLVTLETRHTGRSKQIEYEDHLPNINSEADRKDFLDKVLGDPSRTMLSKNMTEFLQKNLHKSVKNGTSWRLIGNQIPMARTHVPNISEDVIASLNIEKNSPLYKEVLRFKKLGELDLPIYTDTWDGYPVAREAFYQTALNAGAQDLLVLTGDSHAFWLNQLFDKKYNSMGYEIGTTGVTSPGDFQYFGPENAKRLDALMTKANPEVIWTDNISKGYTRLILNKKTSRIDYIAVSTLKSTKFETKVVKSSEILKNGDSGKKISLLESS